MSATTIGTVFEASIEDGVTELGYNDIDEKINQCIWEAIY